MNVPLLKVKLDGELVAEATLQVYNSPAAWLAFQKAFDWLAPMVVFNELTNTVRLACEGDPTAGEQGITIDLASSQLGMAELEEAHV